MKTILITDLKKMIINAYNLFSNKISYINNLNVFPIPDKDTGTNIFLTLSSGINKIKDENFLSCVNLLDEFSKGLLIGARGNSGVIFSQIFAGFFNYFKLEYKNKVIQEITVTDIQEALISANKFAKKSVLKPIKGTILTIIDDVSKECQGKNIKDIIQLFKAIEVEAKKSLDSTPELLKILKVQNVLDAGAVGLYTCFKGFLDYFEGNLHKFNDGNNPISVTDQVNSTLIDYNEINFDKNFKELGYCTEGIVYLFNKNISKKQISIDLEQLESDSIILVLNANILKFHLHTLKPWKILNYLSKYGVFYKLKIENMTFQAETHNIIDQPIEEDKEEIKNSVPIKNQNLKDKAIIIIGRGDGISKVFNVFNIDYIFTKEDNIVPSVDELISAFKYVNAKEIFLFTNENSIILTAKNAKNLFKTSKVHIIETHNIFECYACLIYLDITNKTKNILEKCKEIINKINYSVICKSLKDYNENNTGNKLSISKGDYISISKKQVDHSSKSIIETLDLTIQKFLKKGTPEIFTCFFGLDLYPENEDDIINYFKANIKNEVEFYKLNQPFQELIIGVEYKNNGKK